jgi:hypothetical protein
MSLFRNLFGLGRKDKQGKQVRIEHRGKFTRLSRTGGAALRAEKKLGRVNVTVSTSKGIRLSTKATKNVRVALQSGHFRLIGRWKSGPWGYNLSKTGVSASYKNKMGTFNFIKPQYSSFKFAGIQLRGRKAAQFQLFYGIIKLYLWFLFLVPRLLFLSIKLMIFLLWLLSLPVLFLIDLTVWFFSEERRKQAIEDLQTKNINEQEDIDSGNLRVGADWMGGKLKSDRIKENNSKIKKLQGSNP